MLFAAEAALRRQRHDGAEADRRSANLSRRRVGGLHRADGGRGGQPASRSRSGSCRWRADAPRQITHDGRSNQPAALVAGFQADRFHFRPRRLRADLADGPGRRQRQAGHQSSPPKPMASCFRPTARTCCSPAKCIRSAAPTTPATRRTSTPTPPTRSKARIYTELLYRHWTAWQSRRRSHLLVVPVAGGAPRDLTPGTRDVPPFSLGGPDDYDISPDGKEVCYSDECRPGARHQHQHRSVRGFRSKAARPRKITSNPGADSSPQYSPDGKYIAWRAQFRAGYESDRWRLMVLERATGQHHQPDRDRWTAG